MIDGGLEEFFDALKLDAMIDQLDPGADDPETFILRRPPRPRSLWRSPRSRRASVSQGRCQI
jgi:hypothetical protein